MHSKGYITRRCEAMGYVCLTMATIQDIIVLRTVWRRGVRAGPYEE